MITINPLYEAIFNPRNIDKDCNKIADVFKDATKNYCKELRNGYKYYAYLCLMGR